MADGTKTPFRKPCGAACPTSHSLHRSSTGFRMFGPRNSFRASQGNDFRVLWNETLTCNSQNMDTGEMIPGPSSAIVFYLSDIEAPITAEACLASLRSNWEGRYNRLKISEEEFLTAFNQHLISIADARIGHVRTWLEENTARFAQHADVQRLFQIFNELVKELKSHVALCGVACASCSLSCLKVRQHDDAHECSTTHKCPHACEFDDQHDVLLSTGSREVITVSNNILGAHMVILIIWFICSFRRRNLKSHSSSSCYRAIFRLAISFRRAEG